MECHKNSAPQESEKLNYIWQIKWGLMKVKRRSTPQTAGAYPGFLSMKQA